MLPVPGLPGPMLSRFGPETVQHCLVQNWPWGAAALVRHGAGLYEVSGSPALFSDLLLVVVIVFVSLVQNLFRLVVGGAQRPQKPI